MTNEKKNIEYYDVRRRGEGLIISESFALALNISEVRRLFLTESSFNKKGSVILDFFRQTKKIVGFFCLSERSVRDLGAY